MRAPFPSPAPSFRGSNDPPHAQTCFRLPREAAARGGGGADVRDEGYRSSARDVGVTTRHHIGRGPGRMHAAGCCGG